MKPIYLESDEEITSVIDKIKAAGDGSLALVVAKNSPIGQSLVNLKLIAKESEVLKKEVCIITTNRVSLKLASQVGLRAYSSLGSVGSVDAPPPKEEKTEAPRSPEELEEAEEERLADGTVVNQYRPDKTGKEDKQEERVEPKEEVQPKSFEPSTIKVESEEESTQHIVDKEPIATPESHNEEPEEEKEVSPMPKIEKEPELPSVVRRTISVAPTIKREFHFPWKSAIIAGIILVIGGLLSMLLLPRATIVATFPATYTEGSVLLNVKTTSDSLPTTLSGSLLTASKTATASISATGKKDIGTKATGTVTLYNKASSSSVTLSAGAGLSSGGKTFTLDKSATIPGASVSGGNVVPGQFSASITATAAGTDSNLSNAQFTITGQSSLIYASGSTSGGSTKEVTVLSQEDVDKALTTLRAQVEADAKTEMESKAAGQTVIDGSIWESSKKEEVDKAVGAQVDSATATVDYELSAIAFDKAAAEQKLAAKLGENLEATKEFRINPDVAPTVVFKSYSNDNAVLNIEVAGSGYIVTKIDSAKIISESKNKSVDAVKEQVINTYGATQVEVKINPNWWFGRLPMFKNQIKLEFGYDAKQTPAEGVVR